MSTSLHVFFYETSGHRLWVSLIDFFFTYLTQQRIQSNDSCKTTAGIDWQLAVDEELREFQHHLQPTLF